MPKVALTKGYEAIVDSKDYPRVIKFNWHAWINPKSNRVYALTTIDKRVVQMGRIIINPFPCFDVDHINNNPLDNRRRNLRIATRAQNCHNLKPHKDGCGYKGVYLRRLSDKYPWYSGKWNARIMVEGKRYDLGHFDTAEAAALAYNKAAVKYHGVFARLNVIRESVK